MSEETAVAEFSAETKEMGDKIADLTLKQAKELSDYLKEAHGIEPAAGGGAVMVAAGPADAGPAEEEKTEFDVVLTGFGDKKLNVVKVVKNLTGASLMEAKKWSKAFLQPSRKVLPRKKPTRSKAKSKKLAEPSSSSNLSFVKLFAD